jgi:hypothetical protein
MHILGYLIFVILLCSAYNMGTADKKGPTFGGQFSQGYIPPRARLTFWDILTRIVLWGLAVCAMSLVALGWLAAIMSAH